MSDTKDRDRPGLDGTSGDEAGQPREIQITEEMITAGIEALSRWKGEDHYQSDREAVVEIFIRMTMTTNPIPCKQE